MAKDRIYVDVGFFNTQVALVSDGVLSEYYIEMNAAPKIVGNIYKGTVVNVLNGMQAAFVNIGLDKNAFLFAADMPDSCRCLDDGFTLPDTLSLKNGDEIICQVIKDEVGSKGARISSNISIAGRLVISMPTLKFTGVSRKIECEEKRAELGELLAKQVEGGGFGGIARTVSENAQTKDILAEIKAHKKIWKSIQDKYKKAVTGDVIYTESDLLERTVRDMVTDDTEKIIVNDTIAAERILKAIAETGVKNTCKVECDCSDDLYRKYNIQKKIDALVYNKVNLKSGGELVIDKTEALTVIDVNSSKYVNGTHLEQTVTEVNLEACDEIARQLRLRNIGGIIVVDFIDMKTPEHRAQVLERLECALKKDRIKCRVAGMTSLGLVELTRKKIRRDISHYLQDDCPYCGGAGKVKSAVSMQLEIEKKIRKETVNKTPDVITVELAPELIPKMFGGILSFNLGGIWKNVRVYLLPDDNKYGRDKFTIKYYYVNEVTLPDNAVLLY